MHVATFTDKDQDIAKKSGREFLLKIKGAAVVDRVDGHLVIVRKLKKNEVSTETLLSLLHESLAPRWPGVE
jgi:hypothetical protein